MIKVKDVKIGEVCERFKDEKSNEYLYLRIKGHKTKIVLEYIAGPVTGVFYDSSSPSQPFEIDKEKEEELVKIVPKNELPLYLHLKWKSPTFEKLISENLTEE